MKMYKNIPGLSDYAIYLVGDKLPFLQELKDDINDNPDLLPIEKLEKIKEVEAIEESLRIQWNKYRYSHRN